MIQATYRFDVLQQSGLILLQKHPPQRVENRLAAADTERLPRVPPDGVFTQRMAAAGRDIRYRTSRLALEQELLGKADMENGASYIVQSNLMIRSSHHLLDFLGMRDIYRSVIDNSLLTTRSSRLNTTFWQQF